MSGEALDLAAIKAKMDAAITPSMEEGRALIAEVERLRADAARLDWLDEFVKASAESPHGGDVQILGGAYGPYIYCGSNPKPVGDGADLRAAIDAAGEAAHD